MLRTLRRNHRKLKLLGAATVCLALGGCAWLYHDHRFARSAQTSTPLVDFLYTDGKVPQQDAQPELNLPIRVAVSFLPSDQGPRSFQPGAIDREKVLNALREHFRTLPYVSEIVVVPDYYLHSGKGDGLQQIEQLSRLYRFDLFALVSYDQIQNSYQNDRSLAYWTIVGAYFVHGDRNETHTLLDVAVIDPKTRALVMRAGGTNALKGNASAVDAERHADAQSSRGFELATGQLIENFSRELTTFEQRVREGTAPVKVVRRNVTSGGSGALDPLLLVLLAACAASIATRASRGTRSLASARSSVRD
jgi:rhombotail lipoprotein